jgi:HPt (histidine-containing phosphotransfer) domain-containing protein/two-component sensor histidine kinase
MSRTAPEASKGQATEPSRRFVPLGVKLTIPIMLLTGLVAWGTYQGLLRTSKTNLLQSKEAAADMVVKLFSASVRPAVVFSDETEMQRSVGDLARNQEVMDVELWPIAAPENPETNKLLVEFHRHPGQLGRPEQPLATRTFAAKYLDVVEPITGNEQQPIALARVRFSLAREQAVLNGLASKTLIVAVGVGAALTLALVLMLAKIVVVPLGRLKHAALSLREGARQDDRIVQNGNFEDEVDQLGQVFVGMANAVADREAKLAVRNSELRFILDNVAQGFLTVTADGVIQKERSAIVERWVGPLDVGSKFWDLVKRLDPKQGAAAELGWAQLMTGFLPVDLCIDQLPKRAIAAGQHFSIEYQPAFDGDAISRVVIVLSDITAEVERRRVEEDQKEFASLVDRLVRDRAGFIEFWGELERLVNRLLDPAPSTTLRRDLHTVKGNSRFFGMWRLSTLCHQLEDALTERAATEFTPDERLALNQEWEGLRARIDTLTHEASAFLELSESDYSRLGGALRMRMSHELLAQVVSEFHYEPTRRRLERAKDIAESTCRRLGKPVANVVIEDNGFKLPPGRWGEFWGAFTHVITNAVDHGIESTSAREAAGKTANGNIRITTAITKDQFVVEVEDDGQGVDWERVREVARSRGLPCVERRDLVAALLREGFSTKRVVSELAGRGVGLSAVTHAVKELGGTIELLSESSRGATWRFAFPIEATREPPRASLLPAKGTKPPG